MNRLLITIEEVIEYFEDIFVAVVTRGHVCARGISLMTVE